jgi:hypothetical protein
VIVTISCYSLCASSSLNTLIHQRLLHTLWQLYARGVPPGHFSHALLDEAGHAEEPLALAGLAGLAGPGARLVLAGDPKQLGPVVHSAAARQAGLGASLLERLMAREPYLPSGQVGGLAGLSEAAVQMLHCGETWSCMSGRSRLWHPPEAPGTCQRQNVESVP